MYYYIVKKSKPLNGTVTVSGSKNASLPILAASIINGKTTKLYNLPNIEDVNTTIKILEYLGCKIKRDKNKVIINSKFLKEKQIPDELMRKLRSSVILAGAMIARFKEARFSYPGGCDIGSRPIDLHLKSFQKIGIKIDETTSFIQCKCDKIDNANIHLDFPSVGATENIILAAVLGNHEIKIENAAMEPEIIDLAQFLNKMGAKIYGAGTKSIKIIGVNSLKEVSYRIMPDRIEAGTLMIATAITGGNATIKGIVVEHIEPLISKLVEVGCEINATKDSIKVNAPRRLNSINIKTLPHPGFPTDLQPIFSALLTLAKGTSVVTENIFENRFKYAQELKRMGAQIEQEGKNIIIKGVKKLHGANVESTDLRGGAALLIAGLAASGETKIEKIEYILRGYDKLDLKLNSLGANIIRKEV